ncbi:MAG: cytochrome P450 [Planctomycetes bacterium]|nr:cytochrome P450 [Planctomycetota bacterium]
MIHPLNNDAGGGPGLPVTHGKLMDFPADPVRCMRSLHAAHGRLAVLQEGPQRLVFAFGPQWNQRILSDTETFHSRFFAVRGPRKSAQRRVTSGLLSMNGDEHREHRRLVMGPFQKKTIAAYHDSIAQMAEEMLDRWVVGEIFDVNTEMTQYMLRVTSGILFGVDVSEMAYSLGEKIDRWVHLNHVTGMGAFVSHPSFHDNYDRLLSLAEELESGIQELIDFRRSRCDKRMDVLSLLIKACKEGGTISDEQLIGHVALMFAAAHLTTAHTLTWTLFLLAQHPQVMQQLHEEITTKMAGTTLTPAEMAEMPLTNRVLKESMRILPASGYSQRMCAVPVQLGPLSLAAGTPVIFSQFITHHLPELFEQPERFLPDRWLTLTPTAYEYLPFGAGARLCIGAPMSMMILKIGLPMILKRFRLSVVPGVEINSKIISTMLSPTSPVLMQVHAPDGRFDAPTVTGNIHELVDLGETTAEAETPLRRAA